MNRNTWINFSLVFCLVGGAATQVLAKNQFAQDWRDYYPDSCQDLQDSTTMAQSCIICHSSGFGLNPYGNDYKENNQSFAAIESMDSDGDGRTNGEEINLDCTMPGDAIAPIDQNSWGNIKVLFR